jgi:DNA repair exonuclease SbcCD ATPase subunit
MLSQQDALNKLRDLAEGVACLQRHFAEPPPEAAPLTKLTVTASDPQVAAADASAAATVAEEKLAAKIAQLAAVEKRIADAEQQASQAAAAAKTSEEKLTSQNERLREMEKQIADARKRSYEAESRAATTEQSAADAKFRLAEADRSLGELEESRHALLKVSVKEKFDFSRLKEALNKAEKTIADSKLHARRADELKAEAARLDALKLELKAKENDVAKWSAAAAAASHLKEKLWPGWLRAGSLATWEEKLEAAISSGAATPTAALLFAAIHGYTAAIKDADLKLLHDSLREVSRRLLAWLKENGLDESAVVETAGQWAAEINRECQPRAEVEIPVLGAPATNQWMIFRPRPGVNSPDVLTVQTWCVRNAQKQPIHRAEITV